MDFFGIGFGLRFFTGLIRSKLRPADPHRGGLRPRNPFVSKLRPMDSTLVCPVIEGLEPPAVSGLVRPGLRLPAAERFGLRRADFFVLDCRVQSKLELSFPEAGGLVSEPQLEASPILGSERVLEAVGGRGNGDFSLEKSGVPEMGTAKARGSG